MTNSRIVTATTGEALQPFGLDMRVLLSSQDSGGATSVIIAAHEPGVGPPPHYHGNQSECFFVLEGEYSVTTGDLSQRAGAGTLVFIPRGTVHTFKNVGATTARMLDWSLPGGQDNYFRLISEQQSEGSFNAANIAELSARYDTHFPAPPGAAPQTR
jgi:mannose-6-phosphate isomerase-like protein (cupin superfamily)